MCVFLGTTITTGLPSHDPLLLAVVCLELRRSKPCSTLISAQLWLRRLKLFSLRLQMSAMRVKKLNTAIGIVLSVFKNTVECGFDSGAAVRVHVVETCF